MGRRSRDKGVRTERKVLALHQELGIHGERVPMSGALRYRNNAYDLDLYIDGQDEAPLVCEVKGRSTGEGFKQIEKWLGDADALFLARDRQEPLALLPWRTWVRLIRK